MADLLSYLPEYRDSQAAKQSVQSLLHLWETSREQHPYMFYMGTDFRKLKAPSCWYDIVSVAGVLSKYQSVHRDSRFLEMIDLIKSKQDENGFFYTRVNLHEAEELGIWSEKSAFPIPDVSMFQNI